MAEYSALIRALEWLKSKHLEAEPIIIRGDSRLIINQLNKVFKVKAKRLLDLHLRANALLSEFKSVKLEWVDRTQNKEADLLSRVAYSRYMKSFRKQQPLG